MTFSAILWAKAVNINFLSSHHGCGSQQNLMALLNRDNVFQKFKQSMSSTAPACFKNKHILITGGASGFGLGCARRFAELGANVTIADINKVQGEYFADEINTISQRSDACRFEELDLSSTTSIEDFSSRVNERAGIDVLLNNAGIYPPSQLALSESGQELTFAIAYLGHFRLTAALWPNLLAAENARVISVTSMVQRKAQLHLDDMAIAEQYLPIRAYQRAKLACLMFALELDQRCQAKGVPVRSLAIHPGICRSNLGANRPVRPDDNLWQRLMTLLQGYGLQYFGQSAATAANVAVTAARSPIDGIPFFGPTGPFEAFGRVGPSQPGPAASNAALREMLWQHTETTLNMKFELDNS